MTIARVTRAARHHAGEELWVDTQADLLDDSEVVGALVHPGEATVATLQATEAILAMEVVVRVVAMVDKVHSTVVSLVMGTKPDTVVKLEVSPGRTCGLHQ